MIDRKQPQPAIRRLISLVIAGCLTCTDAAGEVVIDFESDPVDVRAERFTSVDSPLATFSGRLWIRRGLPEFLGTGIETSGPHGITIEFLEPIVSLSILFGNDDPAGFPEDRALLTTFRDSELIGQETLLFNRNDLPDQTITISTSTPFNKAVFNYVDSTLMPVSGLGEVISEVRFQVVPEPPAFVLAGLLPLYAVSRLNRRDCSRWRNCQK